MSDPYASPFPSTQWSVVGRAGSGANDDARRRALATLLARYLPALRSYLRAKHRVDPDRADDLVQGFLTDKVLEQDLIRQADRGRGRFRTFLLTALDNYVTSHVRRET